MKLMLEKIWNEIVRFAHGKMAVDLFGPLLCCVFQGTNRKCECLFAIQQQCHVVVFFLLLLRGPFRLMHKKWKTNEILFAKPIVIIVLLFLSFTFAFSFIHNFGYCLIRFFPLSPSLSPTLSVSIRLRLWLSFLCVTKCWSNCKSLEAANKLNHCMSCDRLYLIMNYNFPERTIFNNINERNLLKQQNFKKNIHKYTREKR